MSFSRSLFIGTVLTSTLFMSQASAEGVYLLQLGSFENQAKAQERWQTLQAKYPSMLQNLDVRLMDVTLPPDNFTVYRTQAGSLSNRADAQTICDRLSSRGDECYVVETAMFNPSMQSSQIPNPPLSVEGVSPQPLASPVARAPRPTAPALATASAAVEAPTYNAPVITPPSSERVTAPVKEEKEESFWSWLNPFGSSDDIDEGEEEMTMASEAGYPTLQPMSAPSTPTPTVQNTDVIEYETQPAPAAPVNLDARTPVDPSQPFQLPPPPAPRHAQAMQMGQAMPAGQPTPVAPRLFNDAPAQQMPSYEMQGYSSGVEVEEAIQVPLSQQQGQSMPAYPTVKDMRELGLPSQTSQANTMWAEIYYFTNQQAALGYWDAFRAANPSFPPKRIRVTSSYMGSRAGRVKLRVGPFENGDDINNLCHDIETQDIYCTGMRDVGASSSAQFGRGMSDRYNGRYQSQPRLQQAMYWVQMGSYASPGEANAAFSQLALSAKPLLDGIQPNIASPIMSSSTKPIYRLRTGPYALRNSADQLCATLRQYGKQCAVIFGR